MKIRSAHGTAYLTKIQGSGWCLESIVVDENYRNTGIGSKLMKKALDKCNRPIYLLATSELGGDVEKLTKFYESSDLTKRSDLEITVSNSITTRCCGEGG